MVRFLPFEESGANGSYRGVVPPSGLAASGPETVVNKGDQQLCAGG